MFLMVTGKSLCCIPRGHAPLRSSRPRRSLLSIEMTSVVGRHLYQARGTPVISTNGRNLQCAWIKKIAPTGRATLVSGQRRNDSPVSSVIQGCCSFADQSHAPTWERIHAASLSANTTFTIMFCPPTHVQSESRRYKVRAMSAIKTWCMEPNLAFDQERSLTSVEMTSVVDRHQPSIITPVIRSPGEISIAHEPLAK